MIEELLHWPIKNKNLLRLGRRVEDINKEFCDLDAGLQSGYEEGLVNMHRARSVQKQIDHLRVKAGRLKPSTRFEKLVLREYVDSLFTQLEFIKFFFTKQYNKDWGVRAFLNYAFLPESHFHRKPEEDGAVAFLEQRMRGINYAAQTRRERLMHDIHMFEVNLDARDFEILLNEQLPRLRKMIAAYNLEMGFEAREQIEAQELTRQQQEIEQDQRRLRNGLGRSMDEVAEFIIEQQRKKHSSVLGKRIVKDEALSCLIYDLVLNDADHCAYDCMSKVLEVTPDRFYFYKDKKGKIKFYSGDIDVSVGHENFHRLQSYFSRHMPPGLRHALGEYNITGRTIVEGAAKVLEDNFLEWLKKNRRRFNLSSRDTKIASLWNNEFFGNKVIRLLHSVYGRELSGIEGKDHYDAHQKLASVSKVPVLGDEDYLNDESIVETFYYSFYIFGEMYVRETLAELEKREIKRLGTKRKARNFLRRNEPLVIQGLLTGNWGWGTQKEFFLSHYWPKARRYCE